jgi:hypothetical protein
VANFEHLPAGFAESWLRAESTRNPELRGGSLAVAAAVRGVSGGPPVPAPPNYRGMSDSEFNAEKAKLGL